jgi:hypothetical protein
VQSDNQISCRQVASENPIFAEGPGRALSNRVFLVVIGASKHPLSYKMLKEISDLPAASAERTLLF